jgi:hypothetical protein
VLDPDVVARSDGGELRPGGILRGAEAVANGALFGARLAEFTILALVNGSPGLVSLTEGRPLSVMAFTIAEGRIATIDILADPDPDRLSRIDLTVLTA